MLPKRCFSLSNAVQGAQIYQHVDEGILVDDGLLIT
jgi:hypothetical protein